MHIYRHVYYNHMSISKKFGLGLRRKGLGGFETVVVIILVLVVLGFFGWFGLHL